MTNKDRLKWLEARYPHTRWQRNVAARCWVDPLTGEYILDDDLDRVMQGHAEPNWRVLTAYQTLDSGKRQEFDSGARRDTEEGKPRYDLLPGSALKRWAELLARGAGKYGDRNWERGMPVSRFYSAAFRHLQQWAEGDSVEDHLAAVLFNVGAIIEMEVKVSQNLLPGWYLDEGASQMVIADQRQHRFENLILRDPALQIKYKFMQHRHGDVLLIFDTSVIILAGKDFDLLSDDELLDWVINEVTPSNA